MPIAFRLIDIYYGTNIIPVNGSDGLWYLLAVHGASMAALGALGFVFIGSMVMDITEQVEEVVNARDNLARIRMVGDNPAALFDFDRHLSS